MQRASQAVLSCLLFLALCTPAIAQPSVAANTASWAAAQRAVASGNLKNSASVSASAVDLDDDIPGVPIPASPIVGALDATLSETDDVFAIDLVAGQRLSVNLTATSGTDFTALLYGIGSASLFDFDNVVAGPEDPWSYPEVFTYTVTTTGTYYLDVFTFLEDGTDPSGDYTLSYTITDSGMTPTLLSFEAPSTSDYASAPVSGYLTDTEGNPIPGQEVYIGYVVGSSGYWDILPDPVITDENGRFSRTMKPKAKTTYQAVFFGDNNEVYIEQMSAERTVLPRASLTRATSWWTLYLNKTYTATGLIRPYHSTGNSNKVKIRAYKKGTDGDYHYVKSFTSSYVYSSKSETAYKAPIKFTKSSSKGYWKFVAYHATDTTNYKTYGSPDYVRVK
ncbi:MAG TPA: pre-peptidase C-terminal domain-containing protein [Coriobacteriia bacterium]|nr:pre-peptidase C-terminal domain-containing protein [Coriobacteriia bacterium]